MISGPEVKPSSAITRQIVIILHGWGADGANLIDLAYSWSETLPDAYFIAPNAPHLCEVNPFGYQWFSLMDRTPSVLKAGADDAAKYVNELIDSLKKPGVKIALVGFSQGTMTALNVALNRDDITCVLGYSGALISEVNGKGNGKFPICLIHGQEDEIVPFAALKHAEEKLKATGFDVKTHARPNLGHGIDLEGIAIGREFLATCLV